ncbi:MAG TPA: hypothetical protein VFR97_04665 [Capillimicrobium sp.]|nr:hypothetical protein [Capillimicrobium sp.]
MRLPGFIELPWARRRRLRAERPTQALGLLAFAVTAAVLGDELTRVVRRTPQHLPPAAAARQTVEVAVQGYRRASPLETRLINLLGSFTVSFALARGSAWAIRRHGRFGPFRNLIVGDRHVHHFVPGIALVLLAGGASVLTEDEQIEAWLAVPFGIGTALTLDEAALLLQLEDVYWAQEGIVSVQVSFAALLMLSGAALALRLLRRGERGVLPNG